MGLRYIFNRVFQMSSIASTLENGSNILTDLPTEILRIIADLLPTSSAAALVLASRGLFWKLGTEYFEQIKTGKGFRFPNYDVRWGDDATSQMTHEQRQWQEFLLLLHRDIPDEIFCHHCQKIHRPNKTGSDWLKVAARRCTRANTAWIFYRKGFNFSRAQLAIKQHNKGLDTSEQLKRLSPTWIEYKQDYTYLRLVDSRINSGTFQLRAQHWLLIPPGSTELPISQFSIRICSHYQVSSPFSRSALRVAALVSCRLSHRPLDEPCLSCSSLFQCAECPTEFQIDGKDMGNGLAIVITAWQNLGKAENPFDPMWMSHFQALYPKPYSTFSPAKIKHDFEGSEPYAFEDHLTPHWRNCLRIRRREKLQQKNTMSAWQRNNQRIS